MTIAAIAIGGCLGATARYGMTLLFRRIGKPGYYATIAVNYIGSFFIGITAHAAWLNPNLISLIVTGFLGAFTTFSTFVMDAVSQMDKGKTKQSLKYIGGTLLGGIVLFAIGWSI